MAQFNSPRPHGRPKNEGKRAAIIEAARRLFGSSAYEAVTMEQVANVAGVAKMTLYSHFQDKGSLFEAIARSTSETLVAALPAMPCSGGDVEEELNTFGFTFVRALLGSSMVSSMHRHAEMLSRNPALAERVYNAGPGRTRAMLTTYLIATKMLGHLSPEQGTEAASDLMSLWIGDMPIRFALGLARAPTNSETARHVRRCTRLFLQAYGHGETARS